ncbi:MAG: stage III sporulation protein AB [Firmicutes bacterium]|nr:stage III sporulation protein AB [Bacillota bacterium]
MILKFMGIVFIMLGSAGFGMYMIFKEKYRLKTIEELNKGLSIIKSEISFLRLPLGDSFIEAGQRVDSETGKLLSKIGERLNEAHENEVSEIFTEAIASSATFLSAEDISILDSLGRTLGYMDEEAHRAALDIAAGELSANAEAIRNKTAANERMIKSVSLLAGILVCILLV